MRIFSLALFLSVLSASAVNAAEKYNPALDRSVFPLQDQTRFYGRKITPDLSQCQGEDEPVAFFNLQENDGKLNFECATHYNSHCRPSCFGGGYAFGDSVPAPACEQETIKDRHFEGETLVLDKETCPDKHGKTLWSRNNHENIVFDSQRRILFYRDNESYILFRDKIMVRRLLFRKDEFLLDEYLKPENYFHVKYIRDKAGNIVREAHYNREGFPYMVYFAEYDNNKCKKIEKFDVYNGTKTDYLFK